MITNPISHSLFVLFILLGVFFIPSQGHATQVQQVETEGTIGFTGVYDPIGSPEPSPPESIARPPGGGHTKPSGRLPKTNAHYQYWLIWLGTTFLLLAILLIILLVYRRRKQKKLPDKYN